MIQLIFIILVFISAPFVQYIKNVLIHTLLWQQKEYRFDRMIAYLKFENSKAFRSKYYYLIALAWIILNFIFFIYPNNFHYIITIIIFVFYLYSTLKFLQEILNAKFKRPKVSIRNFLVTSFALVSYLSILSGILIFLFAKTNIPINLPDNNTIADLDNLLIINNAQNPQNLIQLPIGIVIITQTVALLLDVLEPVFIAIGILITNPLSQFMRRRIINKAKRKISNLKNLKIIGITGSFGKSTTKEFLYLILSRFFKTVMTFENINTTVGIAQTIIEQINEETEVFIAEIGTYKIGEILDATALIPLDISILTNIGPSHLDLLGSIDNIVKAKSEILKGTKEGGVSILNGDDPKILGIKVPEHIQTLYFGSNNSDNPDFVRFDDLKFDGIETNFIMKTYDKKISLSTKIIAPHLFPNLAGALCCVYALGLDLLEIKEILKDLTFESKHFKLKTLSSGVILLDDSYNSNPEGFKKALELLKSQKKTNKILITNGLKETRKNISDLYKDIIPLIENTCNIIYTSDAELTKDLDKSQIKIFAIDSNQELKAQLKDLDLESTAILIEGRIHPQTLEIIKGYKS